MNEQELKKRDEALKQQIANQLGCLTLEQCQQISARIWCDELMKDKVISPSLIRDISRLLYEIYG